MVVQQLSVFLENREGRLSHVTETLSENQINIISVSLADTNEYGMLRMIVSNPQVAKEVLKKAGFSAMLTEVIAVKLPPRVGTLYTLMQLLAEADLNLEYMYTLATDQNASIVLKVSDCSKGIRLLLDHGFELFKKEEVYQINLEV